MAPPVTITVDKPNVLVQAGNSVIQTPAPTEVHTEGSTPLVETPAPTAINPGATGQVTIVTGVHRTNIVPIGVINGVNTVFTTPEDYIHNGTNNEMVYLRGLRRAEGAGCDYIASESGGSGSGYDTITFSSAPKTDDVLLMDYFTA